MTPDGRPPGFPDLPGKNPLPVTPPRRFFVDRRCLSATLDLHLQHDPLALALHQLPDLSDRGLGQIEHNSQAAVDHRLHLGDCRLEYDRLLFVLRHLASTKSARPISPKEERPGVTRLVSELSPMHSLRRFLHLCNLPRTEVEPSPARTAPHPGHQDLETPELVHDRRVTIHDLNRAGLTTTAGTAKVSPHVVGRSRLRHLLFLSPNPHVLRLPRLARCPSCLRSMGRWHARLPPTRPF